MLENLVVSESRRSGARIHKSTCPSQGNSAPLNRVLGFATGTALAARPAECCEPRVPDLTMLVLGATQVSTSEYAECRIPYEHGIKLHWRALGVDAASYISDKFSTHLRPRPSDQTLAVYGKCEDVAKTINAIQNMWKASKSALSTWKKHDSQYQLTRSLGKRYTWELRRLEREFLEDFGAGFAAGLMNDPSGELSVGYIMGFVSSTEEV